MQNSGVIAGVPRTDWAALADVCLSGETLSFESALSILKALDEELLTLLDAAYTVRRHYFGNTVQLYYLQNAKSGLCAEDCGYCSQATKAHTKIKRYAFLSHDDLVEGARRAAEAQACTYCMVASGRGPTEKELDHVLGAVVEIKKRFNLKVCCCLGLLKEGQAERLKAAGVDRFNHNLNTSEDFHENVVTTHGYDERVRTIERVKHAGISPCSGGIIGLGEGPEDIVSMAFALRDIEAESIPVNFYYPVPGTRFEDVWHLNPRYCLKVLCLYRFANPSRELRIAGGRELHLGSMQAMGLYPANSIFVSDYLTTPGQDASLDYKMIEDLGFTITGPNAKR
jgi:biotin synthase